MSKFLIIALALLGTGIFLMLVSKLFAPPLDQQQVDNEPVEVGEVTDLTSEIDPAIQAHITAKSDLIQLSTPAPGAVIESRQPIIGKARGNWFFEASFPIVLTDWDGKIIAERPATAVGEWMTEDFVPFTAILDFESPYHEGDPDFMQNGMLILQKDNPSGLPEHDDALEIPVKFAPAE